MKNDPPLLGQQPAAEEQAPLEDQPTPTNGAEGPPTIEEACQTAINRMATVLVESLQKGTMQINIADLMIQQRIGFVISTVCCRRWC